MQSRNPDRTQINAARLAEMQSELSIIEAQTRIPALTNHPIPSDTFPVRLPASLALTPILAPSGNNFNGHAAVIDAIFSTKAPPKGDDVDSAHVIMAGDTLYIHGCRLPEQATVLLEALNNPFQGPRELDAYGWSTMKSVKLPPQLCEGDYRLTLVGENGEVCANTVFLTVQAIHAPLYVSLFAGMKCVQTSVPGCADHPYLLGVVVEGQGCNIVWGGGYPALQAGQRVSDSLMLGGRYNQAGQMQPITEPGNCAFHIGIGANNASQAKACQSGAHTGQKRGRRMRKRNANRRGCGVASLRIVCLQAKGRGCRLRQAAPSKMLCRRRLRQVRKMSFWAQLRCNGRASKWKRRVSLMALRML